MSTVSLKYLGNLRTECTHNQSGSSLITDAPTDNNGLGEAFSPTDLCATALASCAMTIMGIYAKTHHIDITDMKVDVNKTMSANPRRIGKLEVIIHMPNKDYSAKERAALEKCAQLCPVHMSLHPDIEQIFTFHWGV